MRKRKAKIEIETDQCGDNYVAKSRVGGLGLFANQYYAKEQLVAEYGGELKSATSLKSTDETGWMMHIPQSHMVYDGHEYARYYVPAATETATGPGHHIALSADCPKDIRSAIANRGNGFMANCGNTLKDNNVKLFFRYQGRLNKTGYTRVYLKAKRAIQPGEEILLRYKNRFERELHQRLKSRASSTTEVI